MLTAAVLAASLSTVLDPAIHHGVWEGWGTSLCWMGNVFGDRDDVADLLFSRKEVEIAGQKLPGLGMNIVRYNAGACSWNEVDGCKMQVSKIILPYRQMQGFWLDGRSEDPASPSWDWSVDKKQRAMMQKAKKRGAIYFELFSNSPMWWMCTNDNPSGSLIATRDNLRPAMYDKFAIYLATIAAEARKRWGIEFTTVEPFNEPVTDYWFADSKQEGCHFSIKAQMSVLRRLRHELDLRGLESMQIAAADETSYDQALATWKGYNDETRALVDQVNVHGYQGARGNRAGLYEATKGKRLWNSEYGENDESGLSLMRNLHLDFDLLHPIAWCYWQPLDGSNWGLLDADMPSARIERPNTKVFVLAHYTRHILPGMKILETGDRNTVAAFDPAARKLSIVVIGGDREETKTIDLSRLRISNASVARWITQPKGAARYQRLADQRLDGDSFIFKVPANSVQTFEVMDAS